MITYKFRLSLYSTRLLLLQNILTLASSSATVEIIVFAISILSKLSYRKSFRFLVFLFFITVSCWSIIILALHLIFTTNPFLVFNSGFQDYFNVWTAQRLNSSTCQFFCQFFCFALWGFGKNIFELSLLCFETRNDKNLLIMIVFEADLKMPNNKIIFSVYEL